MKILFIGQQGIPTLQEGDQKEHRVQVIAESLSTLGHEVFVLCDKRYRKPFLRSINGISLLYAPLLRNRFLSELAYILTSLRLLWKIKPDVVHVNSWLTASIVRIAALLCPETTYVWTVSHIPHNRLISSLIAWQARAAFDAISTPSRNLQYKLLVTFGLRVTYIPDGYIQPQLDDIPAKRWGLRKGLYLFSTAKTYKDAQWILRAFKATGTKRKLVFCSSDIALQRIARRNKQIVCLPSSMGRSLRSLIRQAHVVIAVDNSAPVSLLLHAMDAERALIVSTNPLHEEVVGTCAYIISTGNEKGLTKTLLSHMKQKKNAMGKMAAIRAQHHFKWERIAEEYGILYSYPHIKRVSVDSANAVIQESLS